MSFDAERLFELLPSIYRLRDAERDGALKSLLSVIAEQVATMEENLEQLYDDQFIETCADWVVPYIGDLIGYRTLHGTTPIISSPRAEVANTIRYRRRKGTATVLEQLARDVTDWPARAVEFFQLLATTQSMNHIRPHNHYSPHLGDSRTLRRLGSPFDTISHTVDVRRISVGRGRHNIPNVGVFLWRLRAFALTASPAVPVDSRRWMFSPLGNNTQLFSHPIAEDEITHLAEPINVPEPISRRMLMEDFANVEELVQYYGPDKSLFLIVDTIEQPVSNLNVCDLSDVADDNWAHMPADNGRIAIDPVLGRIAFPADRIPDDVRLTYHYGFSAPMGGGEYERGVSLQGFAEAHVLLPAENVQTAVDELPEEGIVEIADSGRYQLDSPLNLAGRAKLELRAANEQRPTVFATGGVQMVGGADADVTLNGLLLTGGTLHIPGNSGIARLRIRHCTLVPGLGLTREGDPVDPLPPSLRIDSPTTVVIEHSIVGPVRAAPDANVTLKESILDATADNRLAFAAPGAEQSPGGSLQIENCTVIGNIDCVELHFVSNSVLMARTDGAQPPVRSQRKQAGCVRFSYVPLSAQIPRRYRCQPDTAIREAIAKAEKKNPTLSIAEQTQISDRLVARLRPAFTAQRYGKPGYAQLATTCPREIRTGAEDESEMGAFHGLLQPQRETNLRVRFEEYLRFGLEAGIIYVT